MTPFYSDIPGHEMISSANCVVAVQGLIHACFSGRSCISLARHRETLLKSSERGYVKVSCCHRGRKRAGNTIGFKATIASVLTYTLSESGLGLPIV